MGLSVLASKSPRSSSATAAALMGPAVPMACAGTSGHTASTGNLQMSEVSFKDVQALQRWGGPIQVLCARGGEKGGGALDCGHMAPAFKEGDGYKVLKAGCRQLVGSNRNWHSGCTRCSSSVHMGKHVFKT